MPNQIDERTDATERRRQGDVWQRRDGDIVIAVCDQGAGVEPAERQTIFEPFYTTRAGGTGLGLAVARQIVAGHGGTFTAVDSPRGARFEIRLPRRRDEVAA